MITLDILTLFLVFLIGFAAGFLDSIVGGGGLIATPALLNLFPSFEILRVIATNRTSSIAGTSVAAINYFKKIEIDKKIVFSACISAAIFSLIGAELATYINPKLLKTIVLAVIVVLAIYTYFKKDLGQTENIKYDAQKLPFAAAGVAATCGFYNGLIGPGTGTLLVFAFVSIIGMDFLKSSAMAKVTNVAGDIGSWTILVTKGFVFWQAAIPLILGNMLGSQIGSKLAILKGSQFIRTVFLCVVFALILKIGWDLMK
jgi:uncharacterized membrane protein YfcA